MNDKPSRASGYDARQTALVRRACLEVATRLEDFKEELCIVGGLVPSLLVDVGKLPAGAEAHIGTYDVDLGMSIAILDEERYEEIAKRLREAGFKPDHNEAGRPTAQRWVKNNVLIDFLIPPSVETDKGGRLRNLESDFAAVILPGLDLAFRDREEVTLEGETLSGGTAKRTIYVCGPGAFIVLKALAFRSRGKEKDAYDLAYVLRHHSDTARRMKALRDSPETARALDILREDFTDANSIGPRRAAEFLGFGESDEFAADVAGLVRALIAEVSAE